MSPREETSAAEDVVRRLRADVMCLAFAPGESITERALEALFGVSRTVVRQALMQLTYEGLIRRVARGYVVAPFDLSELDEVFEYRHVVEDAAVRLACQFAREDELDTLKAEIDAGLREFTAEGWMEIGLDFHVRMAELSRNRFLRGAVHEVTIRTMRARWLSFSAGAGPARTHAEHSAILAAVRNKDADAAAAATHAHAREVHRLVREAIQDSRRVLGRRSVVGAT